MNLSAKLNILIGITLHFLKKMVKRPNVYNMKF